MSQEIRGDTNRLNHGPAYVMQAPGDPITNLVAPLAPLHGRGPTPT